MNQNSKQCERHRKKFVGELCPLCADELDNMGVSATTGYSGLEDDSEDYSE